MTPLTDAIKRAPRWAWVTAAGIGMGAAAIKLYQNRATDDTGAGEAETIGDPSSPFPVPTNVGNPVATIVPPVIIDSGGDGDTAAGALSELYMSGIRDVMGGYEAIWGPTQTQQQALLTGFADTIQDLAAAGGPPDRVATPAALIMYPAPAPAAPRPVPAPASSSAQKKCPSGWVYNPSTRTCYKTYCCRKPKGCNTSWGKLSRGKWNLHDGPGKGKQRRKAKVGSRC